MTARASTGCTRRSWGQPHWLAPRHTTRRGASPATAVRLEQYAFPVEDTVSTLQVELVAADRKVWEGEAEMVQARTIDGELGILPGHTPLLGVLVEGEVRIKTGGSTAVASRGRRLPVRRPRQGHHRRRGRRRLARLPA